MFTILEKEHFSENVVKLIVEAPQIARSRRPGHFVIVRCGEGGERIPLTIADADPVRGTIMLVVQQVGVSTRKICALEPGDSLTDVVGPLGQATHISHVGTVVCCGGGVGVAPLLPIIKAMKQAGNRVVTVLAARTRELVILEDQVSPWSDEVIVMTDGSDHRTCRNDEVRGEAYGALRSADYVLPQHHNGRWHRHVRSLQGDRRRPHTLRVCRRAGV